MFAALLLLSLGACAQRGDCLDRTQDASRWHVSQGEAS
jgi:hypothetical protein